MTQQRYMVFTERTALKLSTQLTNEEYRRVFAELRGIPLERVPLIDIEEELAEIKHRIDGVNRITAGLKQKLDESGNAKKDKYEELDDIGRFILEANKVPGGTGDYQLDVPTNLARFPDFVLKYAGKKIGVEHTRLLSQDTIQIYKSAKAVLRQAQEIIAPELSHLSKTVNIFIDYGKAVVDNLSFNSKKLSPKQKLKAAGLIAEFLKSGLQGVDVPAPEFISQVYVSKNYDSRLDIELGESFITEAEFTEELLKRLAEKEQKAKAYRAEISVDQLWLLIIVDDIVSYSNFNMESFILPVIESSGFDYIWAFEKHAGKVHGLYPQSPI